MVLFSYVPFTDILQILLRKVHNDLALNAITPSAPHARLAIFAAGFLTLCLAALSGVSSSVSGHGLYAKYPRRTKTD